MARWKIKKGFFRNVIFFSKKPNCSLFSRTIAIPVVWKYFTAPGGSGRCPTAERGPGQEKPQNSSSIYQCAIHIQPTYQPQKQTEQQECVQEGGQADS